jgi:flavodoxin
MKKRYKKHLKYTPSMASKTLVVYYSYEGSTRLIAQTIAAALEADIMEVKPTKDINAEGFMKYVWGGRQVVLRTRPSLEAFEKNPVDYERIIIGTPVWSFTYTPAIRSFFSQVDLRKKNIGVFCCHEGTKGNTLTNMKRKLSANTIIGENDFLNVVKNKEENIEKAKQWARTLEE